MAKNFEKSVFWIYYNKEKFGTDFSVEEFGWHKNEPGYEFEECRVNTILQIIYSGTCFLTIWDEGEERHFTLHAGEAFLISAGVKHKYTSDVNDACSRYWLACSGYEYKNMLSALGVKKKYAIVSGINCEEVFKNYKILRNSMKHTRYSVFDILSATYAILSLVSKALHEQSGEAENKVKSDVFIDSVIRYIDKHLKEDLRVKTLSKFFGYERTYFYKIFKKNVGMSIQEYVTKKRINTARSLISDTDKPFVEIANEVGYVNYSSFYKMFIQIAGYSPEDYRFLYGDKNK